MKKILIRLFGGYTAEQLKSSLEEEREKKIPLPVPPFMAELPSGLCSCHEQEYFTQMVGGYYPTAWVKDRDEMYRFLKKWAEGLDPLASIIKIPWVEGSVGQEGCPCGSFGGHMPPVVREGTTIHEIQKWVESLNPSLKIVEVVMCPECGRWDFGPMCHLCGTDKAKWRM